MDFRPTVILLVLAMLSGTASVGAEESVDYLRQIKPMLAARCYSCHGAHKQESALRLDTAGLLRKGGESGEAFVPGKSSESLLVEVLTGNAGFRMPPEDSGKALSEEEIQLVKAWIDQGGKAPSDEQPAEDPKYFWSYQLPKRAPLPQVKRADWVRNPIDAFVAAEHEKYGLTPRPEADRQILLRRVYLDLVGLPPSRTELHAFMADTSSGAYEKVVDDLLSRPEYGERWGRHWMDIWRYSDWYGSRGINEIRYSQRHIWRWRDWIVESLNADKSYDQMIIEMLAGDEVAPTDPNTFRATGFLGRNWYKFDRNVWMFETVEQTSKAFLGVTLKCARCHDHKYDPIAQKDYYRFRAFFEPHDVRTDPLTAGVGTQKDATLGQVLKDGVARVYDKQIDVPTYVFVRGDDRHPDKENPLAPGVPAALGNDQVQINPVSIPLEGYYPAMRADYLQGMIDKAQSSATSTKDSLKKESQRVVTLQKAMEDFDAGKTQSEDSRKVFLKDSFDSLRPDVWKPLGPKWKAGEGGVSQTYVGVWQMMTTLAKHPQDFQARVRYTTGEAGQVHSVGVAFDAVGIRDYQAIYTWAKGDKSAVQAFHRQAGRETYPKEAIIPQSFKLNQEIVLDIAVRGSQLNVWADGKLVIAYTMPIARQSGTFMLWTHGASATFHEVRIEALSDKLQLARSTTEKRSSPFVKPSREEYEKQIAQAQRSVILATKQVAVAEAELTALKARIAAERARVAGATDIEPLAMAAGKAALTLAVVQAEYAATLASDNLTDLRAAPPAADGKPSKALLDAEKKFKAAEKALAAAQEAATKESKKYPPLGSEYPKTSTGRRLALARWIANDKNPRTARVAINHMWLRHFGAAIVPTVANFGLNGKKPTHPELLDWLAVELAENDWKMKHIHRLMVLSNTYRMTSASGEPDPAIVSKDPNNQYLWRMNYRRMEAEVVRDSILSVAGKLDRTRGGPELEEKLGQNVFRRSLYFRNTPNEKMQFLELFDVANPNACYRRIESVVPQQALAMTNSALSIDHARQLAKQLSTELGGDENQNTVDAFVTAAFEQILSRTPSDKERSLCKRFLENHASLLKADGRTAFPGGGVSKQAPSVDAHQRARENLVHILFNHNDFVTIR